MVQRQIFIYSRSPTPRETTVRIFQASAAFCSSVFYDSLLSALLPENLVTAFFIYRCWTHPRRFLSIPVSVISKALFKLPSGSRYKAKGCAIQLLKGFESTALNILVQIGIRMSIFSIEWLLIFISAGWYACALNGLSWFFSLLYTLFLFAEHIFKFASVLWKKIHIYYICLVHSTRAVIVLWN